MRFAAGCNVGPYFNETFPKAGVSKTGAKNDLNNKLPHNWLITPSPHHFSRIVCIVLYYHSLGRLLIDYNIAIVYARKDKEMLLKRHV